MSGAIGGGAVNLATLWVPVLPEVSGFTSKLAEAVVGGATMAIVDRFVGLFGEMAKKAAEGLGEIAKGVYEIGEQFQTLEYQVSSFSDAQGAALESLQNTAAQVFSQLDTGAKNLGENMDVFHQRLGVTGESLRQLTYDYTELTSRLGNVDARAFSAALDAYGVSGDKADAALRTLAADSRHYADTMSNLTTQLETANPVFDLLGIGFNGAAEAMAKIDAIGPNAMKVMNGIAMSGKEFAKLPNGSEDFKKFISDTIDAIDYYNAHDEGPKAQQLTWDMFGSRQAPIVLRSLKTIKEAMEGVGAEGRKLDVDQFVEDTRKLDQTWELFIHRLEFDLKPIGDTALKGLETGVKWLGDFLTAHEGEIVDKITGWGDAFIQALPSIQHFVGVGISLLGDFFQFMNVGTQAMLSNVGLIMQAWGTLTGDDSDIKMGQNLLDMANQLNKVDLSKFTDGIAKLIEAPTIDTAEIQKKWDEAMGRVRDQASKDHGSLGASIDVSIDPKAPDGSALTDPKQLFPGLSTDGTLHLPTTLDPPDNRPPPPPDAPRNSKGEVIITQDSPVIGGSGGGPNQPSWMPGWLASILGYGASDPLTPKANADTSAFNPGPRAPGSGAAAAPGIVHTGDPSDPVHVAVVLSAFSAPLGDPSFTQVPGGGWGRGGGGASHSANKGYGSLGPGTPANVYDAPTDPRNQLPGKKSKSADPGDLLGPLLDMLGFGNVLGGVNPEDWGIVKLFKGLAGYLSGPGRGSGGSGSGGSSGGSGGSGSPLMDALGLGDLFHPGSTGPAPGPAGPDDGSGGTGGPPPSTGGFTPGQIPGHPMGPGHVPWYPPGSSPPPPSLPPPPSPASPPPPVPATSYDQGGMLVPGQTTASNQTGKPETVVPPGAAWLPANPTTDQGKQLMSALKAQGFSDTEITGLVALNSVETGNWSHPESIMGITDNQSGPGIGPHVQKFKNMWDDRQANAAVPKLGQPETGVDAAGKVTDPGKYASWLLKMEGYSPTTDWKGNKYPVGQFLPTQDYHDQVADAYKPAPGGAPGAPGGIGGSADNAFLPAWKALLGAAPYPGSGPNPANPLAFGLGLGSNPQLPKPPPPPGAKPGGPPQQFPAPKAMPGAGQNYDPDWALKHGIDPMFHKSAADMQNTQHPGDAAPEEIPAWAYTLGAAFGLTPKDHGDETLHGGKRSAPGGGNTIDPSASWAFDFFPTKEGDPQGNANMQRLSDYLKDKYAKNMIQLIHGDPDTHKTTGIAGGQVLGPGAYYTTKGGSYFPDESDEVHAAFAAPVPPPNISAAPNVSPLTFAGGLGGGPGAQAERRGDTHIHGDYMPMKVTPSAIDPKPAVTAMQNHQNAMVGSAGGFGGLPK